MSTAAKRLSQQKHLLPVNSPVPNRRILVIDDEPEIAAGIKRLLCPAQQQGSGPRSSRSQAPATVIQMKDEFEVVVVHRPQDAYAAVKQSLEDGKPFAMGFFDVMLGADIDGIELVKQVLTIDPRLYAVFVTAYHDRNVDTIGSYLGHENREKWDYINKPFTDGEILQKARNATSLWDLHRLKDWQAERLNEAHQRLMEHERQTTVAAVGRSVAHEFGNLLTHIIGRAELAKGESDIMNMRRSLDVILKAGHTAATVLRRFRKMNDVSDTPALKLTDLRPVIEESIEIMEFRFRKHRIEVNVDKLTEASAEVHRSAVVQVLVNLFINAIHVMKEGGTLYLETSFVGKDLHLKVRDTGPGIPPEILPRVTDALFTTKGDEGSGLGLAICKEIIEIEHRGEFQIANHSQGGAEITMIIPVNQEKNDEN